MDHLSHEVGKIYFGTSTRSAGDSMFNFVPRAAPVRNLCQTLLVVSIAFLSSSFAQLPVLTSRADISRTGANTNETLLTPANVSKNSFGRLFSFPVDYVVMAQPLYVPNVKIPGHGTHNVIYIVTQADSVYAIDADNGAQLWYASMLNVGGTTASGIYLPCGTGPGYNQEGIVSTPVIDPATNTMYLVAKTLLNTTVRHHLHALDITTGNEQAGSPVLITATSTSNAGHVTVFKILHQKNRPGLLLLNGVRYLGIGSNSCNDGATGWVLSYDANNLSQLAVFNTSPDHGLASIWQAGVGLAADTDGNIFVETAETGAPYDVPNGGQTFCNSVLKLAPDLTVADYFTPWSVAYLNSHDLDLSSTGTVILPDQDGPYPHELIAGGKQGIVYVLNRDSLGMFSANDSQVLQEVVLEPSVSNDVLFGSPAYWNNTLYFAPRASPLMAFPLSGGRLGTPLTTGIRFPQTYGRRMKKWCNGRYSTGTARKALQLAETLGWETGIENAPKLEYNNLQSVGTL
jgi:outer membrane protein assembly factor BamB